MNKKDFFYPESTFGGFTDIDGTIAFFNRVNSLIKDSFVILDIGCGRGEYSEDPIIFRKQIRVLKGKASKIIGLDVDQNASSNPFLDEFHLLQDSTWPIESNSIDLIVCDNVLEHLPTPDLFFNEVRRVLKSGGFFCARTPNRWSYVAIAAMLVPNKFHAKVLSVVQDDRKEEDVFPTYYKCNSSRKLGRLLRQRGFSCVVYGHEAEPAYLSFSIAAYLLGVIHQKFAPGFLKPTLFAFGRKGNG